MAEFGYHTASGTGSVASTNAYLVQYISPADANGREATKMAWYLTSSDGTNLKFALYADNAGAPGALLASGSGSMGAETNVWIEITFDTPYVLSGSTPYWFAVRAETATTYCDYATGAANNAGRVSVTYADFPTDPCGSATAYTDRRYSAYVTYADAPAGLPIPLVMANYRRRRI